MSIDAIIDVTILLGAQAVSRAGFGTPLIVTQAANLNVGFTERTRAYADAEEANADADLTSDPIARLTTGFAQSPAPDQQKIGRREADAAQTVTFTLTGSEDGDYTITINGTDYTFTAATNTVAEIVDGLAPLVDADPDVSAVSDGVDTITVTADVAGTAFTFSSSAPGASSFAEATTVENVNVATELALILAEDSDWYGVVLDTRSDTDIERASAFIEANRRLFFGQTSSADVITSATTDIASDLQSQSLRRTAILYYSDDAENTDIAWMAKFLASDFDQFSPTAWGLTLATIPTEELGTTAQNNLRAKNANWYTTLKGVGATANAQVAGGFDIELIVTVDWLEARGTEAVAQLFLDVSNSSSRIRYNNEGFRQVSGEFFKILKQGERIGHFNDETSELDVPDRSEVPDADVKDGILRIEFGTQYSGRVKEVDITGVVSTDFEGLAA